ncbi:hypothetical protein TREES_T100001651 [Tupaia chinensis]|uniref:Uncharacterized protein n=1 Tax=Tupaia chinensis TaxID=246437 RepID=L9KJ07_TUPCH|nr:hypothetical protein TREES_T100001651 [Tupaia chinensis]
MPAKAPWALRERPAPENLFPLSLHVAQPLVRESQPQPRSSVELPTKGQGTRTLEQLDGTSGSVGYTGGLGQPDSLTPWTQCEGTRCMAPEPPGVGTVRQHQAHEPPGVGVGMADQARCPRAPPTQREAARGRLQAVAVSRPFLLHGTHIFTLVAAQYPSPL